MEIFRAVLRWWRHNYVENSPSTAILCGETTHELDSVLEAVRLPLISLSELLNEVRPSNLVSADVILDALKTRTESRDSDLPYRGQLCWFSLSYFNLIKRVKLTIYVGEYSSIIELLIATSYLVTI